MESLQPILVDLLMHVATVSVIFCGVNYKRVVVLLHCWHPSVIQVGKIEKSIPLEIGRRCTDRAKPRAATPKVVNPAMLVRRAIVLSWFGLMNECRVIVINFSPEMSVDLISEHHEMRLRWVR